MEQGKSDKQKEDSYKLIGWAFISLLLSIVVYVAYTLITTL